MFSIADAARHTGIPEERIRFWCGPWGAALVEPSDNPGTRGGTKFLSERDLVKVALIPKLLALGLHHDVIRRIFRKFAPEFWDLSEAVNVDPNFLDWLVIVWLWNESPRCYAMASTYRNGPTGQPSKGAMKALFRILDDALFSGAMRGFTVIEFSNIKRELLEKING
jgi:hypothetical protein